MGNELHGDFKELTGILLSKFLEFDKEWEDLVARCTAQLLLLDE